MLTLVESNWGFLKPLYQGVLKLRGDAQQIFVNGEFSGSSSGFWDYTIYVNPYMVVRPEGHYTKHIYVNSERIASKIGNPEDYAEGDPTGSGSAVGRKIKMEEVVEENFNELFGNVPEIEQAAEQELGMSTGSPEPELNSYWFTSDHLGSSAFVTDGSGVAIQHLEYMAFGEVFVDQRRTGFGTPYKFNAKELDCESGYYYYGARYYDPRMARFLSVDPLTGDFPSQSSYLYAYNNPVRMIDVDGLYGDENEANRQRDLAQAQGHKVVGEVYKSGDEWMFNTMEGDAFTGRYDDDFSQNSSNRNGGMSSLVSIGGAATGAYEDFHVQGGKYRGASGNYYSHKGRRGWNQYTGTKDHMNKTLSKSKWAGRATYGLGALNYGLTLNEFSKGNLSNTAFGIEMASTTIGTFAPSFISIPWTIGYEGLGRNGVARIPWYQNTFKPWARKKMGVE